MHIQTMQVGMIRANCYIVWKDSVSEALVVDPGAEGGRILKWLDHEGLTPAAILITHGHFDHVGGVKAIQKRGVPLYVHPADTFMLGRYVDESGAMHALKDGQEMTLAGLSVKMIHTPGHTPGGVCFLIGEALFAGDTLFAGTIGRTDLPGGDGEAIIDSIQRKLAVLPDGTAVYPGHNAPTTIGKERQANPFFPRGGR